MKFRFTVTALLATTLAVGYAPPADAGESTDATHLQASGLDHGTATAETSSDGDVGVMIDRVPCTRDDFLKIYSLSGIGHQVFCYANAGVSALDIPRAYTLDSGNNAGNVMVMTSRTCVVIPFGKWEVVPFEGTVVSLEIY